MYLPQVFLLAGCLGLIGFHASAEDDFTASFRCAAASIPIRSF
jgi:hypothetical protein